MDFGVIETILFIMLALFAGLVASILHDELRALLLLMTGFLLSMFASRAGIVIDDLYILYLALVVFALYIFDYAGKLGFEKIGVEKRMAGHFLASSLVASLIGGYLVFLMADQPLFYMFVFATVMFVTEIDYARKKSRAMHVLGLESTASVIFVLAFLFAFFDLYKLGHAGYLAMFAEKLLLSVGIGLLSGFLLLRFASRMKHHNLLSFLIVIATLAAAEVIAMPGIALASSALLFSRFSSERTGHTFGFFRRANDVAGLVCVVLAGFVFGQFYPKAGLEFLVFSLAVFAVFFFMRFFSVSFFSFSMREKVFLTMNNPKGGVGALVFLILALTVPRYEYLWAVFFMQVVFSEVVSFLSHSLEDPRDL